MNFRTSLVFTAIHSVQKDVFHSFDSCHKNNLILSVRNGSGAEEEQNHTAISNHNEYRRTVFETYTLQKQ